jgi:hypothetical protein
MMVGRHESGVNASFATQNYAAQKEKQELLYKHRESIRFAIKH